MLNSAKGLKTFINKKCFKKIFILTGENSFLVSGANKFIKKIIKDKKVKVYYKNSDYPIVDELIDITLNLRNFKPDLILAIGGGTVIDYAK